MGQQSKIKAECDAVQVLQALIQFKQECMWTHNMLAEFTGLPRQGVQGAVRWLQTRGYVCVRLGQYAATEEGLEYHSGVCKRPDVGATSDAHKFKDEVLTGMVERRSKISKCQISERSQIESGVLPKNKRRGFSCETTPEDYYMEMQARLTAKSRIASSLGITVEKVEELMEEGRISYCDNGERHLGIFDKKGHKLRSKCRKCRKADRR